MAMSPLRRMTGLLALAALVGGCAGRAGEGGAGSGPADGLSSGGGDQGSGGGDGGAPPWCRPARPAAADVARGAVQAHQQPQPGRSDRQRHPPSLQPARHRSRHPRRPRQRRLLLLRRQRRRGRHLAARPAVAARRRRLLRRRSRRARRRSEDAVLQPRVPRPVAAEQRRPDGGCHGAARLRRRRHGRARGRRARRLHPQPRRRSRQESVSAAPRRLRGADGRLLLWRARSTSSTRACKSRRSR